MGMLPLFTRCLAGNRLVPPVQLAPHSHLNPHSLIQSSTPSTPTPADNTLIDVYGKTGAWEEAIRVLDALEAQGIDPEIRTYNTGGQAGEGGPSVLPVACAAQPPPCSASKGGCSPRCGCSNSGLAEQPQPGV